MEGAGATKASAAAEARPHVAIVPARGMGHLIGISALARYLVTFHGFEVTFLLIDPDQSSAAYLRTFLEGIHVETLPPPDLDDVPTTARPETRLIDTIARSVPAILTALSRLTNLIAVVVDLFGADVFDAARDTGVPAYLFFPSNALTLSVLLYTPELDQKTQGAYRDMREPLRLPGCVALEGRDLLNPFEDRDDDAYKGILRLCRKYPLADGIIINTFEGIEPSSLKALQERQILPSTPPIYPVGPLVAGDLGVASRVAHPCLRWLDQQPAGSVLFVSFGSGGALTVEQMEELAAGLEMSGQRFLWVARPPSSIADAAYLVSGTRARDADDPLWFLPQGFLGRTNGVGFVAPAWAPQLAVLAHEATGGFLTHCGWNSVLEALVYGIPLIAWPLYAEQKMNAVMLAEDIGVAIRPASASASSGLVGREEVCRVVKALLEGEEGKRLRNVAGVIRKAGEVALEKGGASSNALANVADEWRRSASAKAEKSGRLT